MSEISTASTNERVTGDVNKNEPADRIAVPDDFFLYVGPSDKESNSLYRCVKCPIGSEKNSKTISCHNKSRQNLKKHVMVSAIIHNSLKLKFGLRINNR